MKTISLFLNVVLIFLLVYLGCNNGLFSGCNTKKQSSVYCPKEGCETYNAGEKYGMISFATAQMLAKNYAESEGKKFIYNGNQKTSEQDALNIWFDLRILKNFIAFVESSACKANCDTSKRLGVRIYYGKYPDSATLHTYPDLADVPFKYARHHTIFMMPTFYDSVKKKHFDFDPLKATVNCNFKPFDASYVKYQLSNLEMYLATKGHKLSGTLNTKQTYIIDTSKFKYDPKIFDRSMYFAFGAATYPAIHNATVTSASTSGEQQNHGDVQPPPDNTGNLSEVAP